MPTITKEVIVGKTGKKDCLHLFHTTSHEPVFKPSHGNRSIATCIYCGAQEIITTLGDFDGKS